MDVQHGFKTSVTLLLVVEMVVGVFCSSSVLFTSWRKNQVNKNVSTILLVNLAGIDLLLSLTGIPLTIISLTWYPRNTLLFCCFHEAVTSSLRNASLLTLLLISYYRYWSVTRPLRIRMSLGKARKMLYISWLVTFLFACIPFIELQRKDTVSPNASHTDTWFGNSSHALYFRMYYFPVFVLACAVLLPLYYKISRTALVRLQLKSIASASILMAPVLFRIQAAKGDSSIRQKKRRIVKLTGAIICSVCGLWLPYTALSFVLYFVKPSLALSQLEFVFLVLGYFNCTLNPVLYAFTKRKFRNAFLSSLPCKRYVEQDTSPS